jgi:hypothetical protein
MDIQELHDIIAAHEIMRIAEQLQSQARRTMRGEPVADLPITEFMSIARTLYSERLAAAQSALKAPPIG